MFLEIKHDHSKVKVFALLNILSCLRSFFCLSTKSHLIPSISFHIVQQKRDPGKMLTSSLLSNALTLDEQQLIPEFVMSKLNEEIFLYEDEVNKRVVELERRIEVYEDTANEMSKRIVKQETQIREAMNNSAMLERRIEEYAQKVESLNNELLHYKNKTRNLLQARKDGVDGLDVEKRDADVEDDQPLRMVSEVERTNEKNRILEQDLEFYKKRSHELEKNNKRLMSKVLDQKNQMSYLLKKNCNSDEARNNLELVRLVQKLSKRNEELEKRCGPDDEPLCDDSVSHSKLVDGMSEGEKYKKMQDELYEVKRNGYELEIEYKRVFNERNEVCNQLKISNDEKKALQKYVEEMKEELMYLKMDLSNTKAKNSVLMDGSRRLAEMNSEIVRSNLIIKESRNRINELRMQLEESEGKYNRYILEDRTNVTALLGREIENIKKRLKEDMGLIYDVEMRMKAAIGEQNKLRSMQGSYEEKVAELERLNGVMAENEARRLEEALRHKNEKQRYIDVLREVDGDVGIVYDEVRETLNELGVLFALMGDIVKLEENRRESAFKLIEELSRMNLHLAEKDATLYSLIENRVEDAAALLGKERNILKQENIFLRNRLETLGDSEDFMEKMNRLEEENVAMRARFGSLEKTYISERERCLSQLNALEEKHKRLQLDMEVALEENSGLKGELEILRSDLNTSMSAVDKYKSIVDKLNKIKDAYLKLRDENKKGAGEIMSKKHDEIVSGGNNKNVQDSAGVVGAKDGDNADNGIRSTRNGGAVDNVNVHAVEPSVVEQTDEIVPGIGNTQQNATIQTDNNRDHGSSRNKRSERPRYTGEGGYKRSHGDRKRGWPSHETKKNRDRRN